MAHRPFESWLMRASSCWWSALSSLLITPLDLSVRRCFLFYFNLLYMMLELQLSPAVLLSAPNYACLIFAYTYLSHRAFSLYSPWPYCS